MQESHVYKCCVNGCLSGNQTTCSTISFHGYVWSLFFTSLHLCCLLFVVFILNLELLYCRFPSNKEDRTRWITALGDIAWEPSESDFVCSLHFDKNDFLLDELGEPLELISDAIPCMHLSKVFYIDCFQFPFLRGENMWLTELFCFFSFQILISLPNRVLKTLLIVKMAHLRYSLFILCENVLVLIA